MPGSQESPASTLCVSGGGSADTSDGMLPPITKMRELESAGDNRHDEADAQDCKEHGGPYEGVNAVVDLGNRIGKTAFFCSQGRKSKEDYRDKCQESDAKQFSSFHHSSSRRQKDQNTCLGLFRILFSIMHIYPKCVPKYEKIICSESA